MQVSAESKMCVGGCANGIGDAKQVWRGLVGQGGVLAGLQKDCPVGGEGWRGVVLVGDISGLYI